MPEKVSPETVMAMALLKAHITEKPTDVEEISGLFFFNSPVNLLTIDSNIALRRVPSGGVPGRGVYSEDVDGFVGRFYVVGYISKGSDSRLYLRPDGQRVCLLVLWDEAKHNSAGLEALAKAMDFKVSELLCCVEEEWLRAR